MCMFLTCTLIWVGVTLLPDLYLVSTTHIGIWAALLTFLLFEGYGPVCGASMSPARTLAYFLAGGFSAARGRLYFLIRQEDYDYAFVYVCLSVIRLLLLRFDFDSTAFGVSVPLFSVQMAAGRRVRFAGGGGWEGKGVQPSQ